MKVLMPDLGLLTVLVSILLMSSGSGLHSQSHPFLGKFYADKIDNSVHLGWVIVAGNTCSGIQILRSIDSSSFVSIGNISGVCGSLTESQHYTFIDRNPIKNRTNYYRLELGGNGQSQIISIEMIDLPPEGFDIRPHPVSAEGKMYFDNPLGAEYHLTIYNLNGVKVSTSRSTTEFFLISSEALASGIYLFLIQDSQRTTVLYGRLVVQH
ncbi:MAG TPA: T9SS type A sorting domain-containing protein [Saprospiraceae bacterium]|nr:T9SS type A sorting domain-containing protein [Saprospiraceae bacterium]